MQKCHEIGVKFVKFSTNYHNRFLSLSQFLGYPGNSFSSLSYMTNLCSFIRFYWVSNNKHEGNTSVPDITSVKGTNPCLSHLKTHIATELIAGVYTHDSIAWIKYGQMNEWLWCKCHDHCAPFSWMVICMQIVSNKSTKTILNNK